MTGQDARYEFRVFATDLAANKEKILEIADLPDARTSREVYFISRHVDDHNVKVRDGKLDMKKLLKRSGDLEQWFPVMKTEFPLKKAVIETSMADIYNITGMTENEYSLAEMITRLILPDRDLVAVNIFKKRHGFEINGCMVEMAKVYVNKALINTIAIESVEVNRIMELRKRIMLEDQENVNYVEALKRITGLKYVFE